LLANLLIGDLDSRAIEVGANRFKDLLRPGFLDLGGEEPAGISFRLGARFAEFSGGPKAEPFVAPRSRQTRCRRPA